MKTFDIRELLEVREALQAQDLQELKERIDNILHTLEAGETVDVTENGKVIAHVVPANKAERAVKRSDADAWADLKRIASELDPYWPKDIDAVEIVRDVRRDL